MCHDIRADFWSRELKLGAHFSKFVYKQWWIRSTLHARVYYSVCVQRPSVPYSHTWCAQLVDNLWRKDLEVVRDVELADVASADPTRARHLTLQVLTFACKLLRSNYSNFWSLISWHIPFKMHLILLTKVMFCWVIMTFKFQHWYLERAR